MRSASGSQALHGFPAPSPVSSFCPAQFAPSVGPTPPHSSALGSSLVPGPIPPCHYPLQTQFSFVGFFFFFFTNTVMTKVCMVAPAVLLEIIFLNSSGLILTKCIYKYIKIHIIAYKKEALCSRELGRHQSSSVVKEFSGVCVLATSGVFTRTDRLSFPSRCFSLLPSAQTLHCTGSNISPAFACWRCLGYPIELWILFCTNGRLHLTWMPPPHTRWLMSFHAGPSSRPPVKYQTPSQKLRESLWL